MPSFLFESLVPIVLDHFIWQMYLALHLFAFILRPLRS